MEKAISLIHQALSFAGTDQQLMERLSHLETRRITSDKELPPMEFLFRLFGMPCFPRGELVGISGKPKSGKTFVCSILMSLCFREEVMSVRRESHTPLRVLWYDTEQSDESTQDILRNRIIPMIKQSGPSGPSGGAGVSGQSGTTGESGATGPSSEVPLCDYLHVFNVRQDLWTERLPMLEAAIEHYSPDLVIVDGIRDLINDINDGVLAQDTVERLMHLASNGRCCIACVLHQNKSAEDRNLRGWIGTELTHKAFEVYECNKDESRVFSLSQTLTRKYDILDKLKYIVDEHGIPQTATVEALIENERHQRQSSTTSRPELNHAYLSGWIDKTPVFNLPMLFADAMPEEGQIYLAKDMQEQVMRISNITSSYFYNKQRELALNDGIIVKTTDPDGHLAYFRPASDGNAPF